VTAQDGFASSCNTELQKRMVPYETATLTGEASLNLITGMHNLSREYSRICTLLSSSALQPCDPPVKNPFYAAILLTPLMTELFRFASGCRYPQSTLD
jgi:hypothetical protein